MRFATVLYDRDGCGEMGRPLTDKILPLQLCHALSLRWSHGLEVDVAVATRGLGKRHSRMHTYHHGHNTGRRAIASCTQHWRLALRGDFIMSENFNLRAAAISTINPVNKYLCSSGFEVKSHFSRTAEQQTLDQGVASLLLPGTRNPAPQCERAK